MVVGVDDLGGVAEGVVMPALACARLVGLAGARLRLNQRGGRVDPGVRAGDQAAVDITEGKRVAGGVGVVEKPLLLENDPAFAMRVRVRELVEQMSLRRTGIVREIR